MSEIEPQLNNEDENTVESAPKPSYEYESNWHDGTRTTELKDDPETEAMSALMNEADKYDGEFSNSNDFTTATSVLENGQWIIRGPGGDVNLTHQIMATGDATLITNHFKVIGSLEATGVATDAFTSTPDGEGMTQEITYLNAYALAPDGTILVREIQVRPQEAEPIYGQPIDGNTNMLSDEKNNGHKEEKNTNDESETKYEFNNPFKRENKNAQQTTNPREGVLDKSKEASTASINIKELRRTQSYNNQHNVFWSMETKTAVTDKKNLDTIPTKKSEPKTLKPEFRSPITLKRIAHKTEPKPQHKPNSQIQKGFNYKSGELRRLEQFMRGKNNHNATTPKKAIGQKEVGAKAVHLTRSNTAHNQVNLGQEQQTQKILRLAA